MRRIVKIDNKEVEVAEGSVPAIIFNNPIFFDMSSMKGNRTTTYKIPLTTHNRGVLGLLDSEDSVSKFMRSVHDFEEWRDGLPVIRNGKATLIAVSPGEAEFSVSWGVLKPVQELLKVKLNELPAMPRENTRWDENTPFIRDSENTPDYGWLQYLSLDKIGANLHLDDMRYHFPSIKVSYLMDYISRYVEMDFTYTNGVKEHLNKLWIPLLTRKVDEDTYVDPYNSSWFDYVKVYRGIATVYKCRKDVFGLSYKYNETTDTVKIALGNFEYRISGVLSFSRMPGGFVKRDILVKFKWLNSSDQISESFASGRVDIYGFCSIPFDFNIPKDGDKAVNEEGSFLDMEIYYYENDEYHELFWGGDDPLSPILSPRINIWRIEDEVWPGQNFPLATNLPDMTGMDFIKSICFISGIYPTPVKENEIRFDFIDNVIANPSQAININERIISHVPKSIKYTYSDYAQENNIIYEKDEPEITAYNGVIKVSDSTLEKSKDIIKVNFAASYNIGINPVPTQIPLFSYDDRVITGFNGNKLKPRILSTKPNPNGILWGYFDPEKLSFKRIIKNRYKVLENVLKSPRVVNIDFRMSTADLYLFRETNLFYFHGKYWLLLQGTYNADGLMSAEFINVQIK